MKTRHLPSIVLARPFIVAPTVLHAPRGSRSRYERFLASRAVGAKYEKCLRIGYQVARVEPPFFAPERGAASQVLVPKAVEAEK